PLSNGEFILYAAIANGSTSNGGVWRSLDTGKTWTRIRAGNADDVVLAAGSKGSNSVLQILYAAFRGEGVFFTPQAPQAVSMSQLLGGQGNNLIRDEATDTAIPFTAPPDTPNGAKGRIVLATPALLPNNPLANSFYQGWLYALVVAPNGTLNGLYSTKDFGHNWTKVKIPVRIPPAPFAPIPIVATNDESQPDMDPFSHQIGGGGNLPPQGNYDVAMAIDPTNPNILFIGGLGDEVTAGGALRVDVTTLSDTQALVAYDNSDPGVGAA